ncbi:hypothetical protein WJX72_005193 [[Myrmecia] bisecta]|uniref:Protein YIP n=1 Tax=[Myrmecia] bisecta TaxID=41462 RepID=A0AAW1PCN5_9CHLO
MSEFQLAFDQNLHSRPGHQQAQQGSQVEWYQAGGTAYAGADYTYSAAGTSGSTYGSFEEEAPLLEELGIDIPGIWKKSRAIATNRFRTSDLESLDLGGPLVFALVMGSVHLLTGKLHFGVLLGWSVVASLAIWFVVNSIAGQDNPDSRVLDLYSCCCLLGYCQLPMVAFAFIALLIPRGMVSVVLAVLVTLWCGRTAAKLFVKRSPCLEDHYYLIVYPCVLMYSAFALLNVY